MELRQLPAQGDAPLCAERRRKILQRGQQLVRRLVEDHRPRLVLQARQVLLTAFFVDGQKALEREPACRQPGDAQRRHQRARAGDGADRHAVLRAQPHEILARVGDRGGARVRHQRARLAREQARKDLFAAFRLVVLMVAHKALFQLQMVQELQTHAGILRRDEIRLRQRLAAAGGDVAEIADGRRHKI